MDASWHSGNAGEDGRETRGWLIGNFIDPAEDVLRALALDVL